MSLHEFLPARVRFKIVIRKEVRYETIILLYFQGGDKNGSTAPSPTSSEATIEHSDYRAKLTQIRTIYNQASRQIAR